MTLGPVNQVEGGGGGGGTVDIDQTTDGVTNAVVVKTTLGGGATIGTTTDAAVTTDANGTVSAKLRGLIKLLVDIISVKIDQTTPGTTNRVVAGGTVVHVAVTPTITAGAYAASDCVGGKITITSAMRTSGGSGIWQSLHIIDKGNQKANLVIQIFNADPTAATLTDNSPIAHSTDISKVIRTIIVASTDYQTVGGEGFADVNIAQTVAAVGSANLYACVMCVATPTYTSTSDLIFDFGFIQN